ncbi:MAG: PKD domain-containing protein [Psychrosphaera sp.]|nr:PKD domain-containing protein [Psychrosphaera sp.]
MNINFIKPAALALTATLLTACGGGSTTPTPTPVNTAPVAQAGDSLVVDENTQVTLAGSGTDENGSIVSYAWLQTGGEAVSLSDSTSATSVFNAPAIGVGSLTLSFELTVTDNDGNTAKDSVEVVVNTTNSAPVANAGVDRNVAYGTEIQLNGSGSDSDGSVFTYLWSQTGGTEVTLSDTTIANPTFTAPAPGEASQFKLQVTDERGAVDSDTVIVVVSVYPLNPYEGRTVLAGQKIEWQFRAYDWSTEFVLESDAAVDLNVYHIGTDGNTRWLIAPLVAEPVEVNLMRVDASGTNELLDTVTIMPIEQMGFKPARTIDNFYLNPDFGEGNSLQLRQIDNDKSADLLVTRSDAISWYQGNGDGSFGAENSVLTGQNIQTASFEDINKD